MERGTVPIPPEVEQAIAQITQSENPAEAALLLAGIANRATAALHQLARKQSTAHKGEADWGRWASLVNASRDAVLRTATCRQAAAQLARAGTSPTPPPPVQPS